ncbi:hypothetical protein [Vibrio phage vB_VmeM-Yong XC32]|nr:hypothetical protein [Vibrio phage vB_VmeM-Yong XC31]QAX96503.1 hypothetical protein [Vibrio phage vB_VmeM-Yong XC32]QAX96820.1 hypothetical protein [Vibrio phage vB_VmeM-Yong MS31]QAX97139.1 hypothetical protein [Vibrio phage vB_VmeM-Yong MS32]
MSYYLMHQANYKKVSDINKIAGVRQDHHSVLMNAACLVEEAHEQIVAVKNKDYHGEHGLMDAIPDTAFVCYGLLYLADFSIVKPKEAVGTEWKSLLEEGEEAIMHEAHVSYQIARDIETLFTLHRYSEAIVRIHDLLLHSIKFARGMGIHIQKAIEVVHTANATKFDTTEMDGLLTQSKYDELGVMTKIRQVVHEDVDYWVNVVDGDQFANNKFWPNRKWLKSHVWQEPRYTTACLSEK